MPKPTDGRQTRTKDTTYGSIVISPEEAEDAGPSSKSSSSKSLGGGDGGSPILLTSSSLGSPGFLSSWTMMPSPHSTSRSSRENLELLWHLEVAEDNDDDDDDVDSAALLSSSSENLACSQSNDSNHKKLSDEGPSLARHGCCSRRMLVFLVGLGLVLAAALYYYVVFLGHTLTIPMVRDDDDTLVDNDDSSSSTTKGKIRMAALSKLDPVVDLGLASYQRPKSSRPPKALTESDYSVYPTNAWYQNLLMNNNDDPPQEIHRVYCIPYIVDAAGMIAGFRLHGPHRSTSNTVIQLNVQTEFGLTMGATVATTTTAAPNDDNKDDDNDGTISHGYNIHKTTPLGLTLEWKAFPMKSSIVYGMPFGTMLYEGFSTEASYRPALHSQVSMTHAVIDGELKIQKCHGKNEMFLVEKELTITFDRSDYTWLVVVSEPVQMYCQETTNNDGGVQWQVDSFVNSPTMARTLVLRVALVNFCSTGINPIHCGSTPTTNDFFSYGIGDPEYTQLLRDHADAFPGIDTDVSFTTNEISGIVELQLDWNVQSMSEMALANDDGGDDTASSSNETSKNRSLITFAMMHHFDLIQEPLVTSGVSRFCVTSLVGPVCLYEGGSWHLQYDIAPISFRAPRPLSVWSLPMIAESLRQDLQFRLPEFYQHGIGDTYFSGKMLAKLARILLVWEEVDEICNPMTPFVSQAYITTCRGITLPKRAEFDDALAALKSSVEIWLNGTAVTPLVYDPAWGGVASCGCAFDSDTKGCRNVFPNCDGFEDPGLNFGNAFYNDMHFHYGYFIMASAVAAHFDPEWGIATYEQVLLLIRCIANPSEEDVYFPTWRFKDFYRGNSWANGIATIYLNGKNQESSSEAIAAYEAIGLYGQAMMSAWDNSESSVARERFNTASDIMKIGQVLATTELRSTRTYWHVQSHKNVYPELYTPRSIGIMWQTMAQFQTWFGSAPYLAYGIQILPLTPISEFRDSVEWGEEMYPTFADSCIQAPSCEKDGWSILQYAMLATLGHHNGAANSTIHLNATVFDSAGGNGHSLTNSLWFIATRPEIQPVPLKLPKHTEEASSDQPVVQQVKDCGLPHVCTNAALDTAAGDYTCRERINWLIAERSMTSEDACIQVAQEFLVECGACAPAGPNECLPCTSDQCSNMSRCPVYGRTFVCLEGGARGGCSDVPWEVSEADWAPCKRCCELTHCMK